MNLYDDYKKFERIAKNYNGSGVLDCSKEYFLAPTTIIPLLCFINKKNISKVKVGSNIKEDVSRILHGKNTSTTSPYTILPNSEKARLNDDIVSSMALNFGHEEYTGSQTIFHVYNELINNVYNHTLLKKDMLTMDLLMLKNILIKKS